MFFVYDHMVEKRQDVLQKQAKKTGAIVSSLFPESVTKRLLADKPVAPAKKFLSPNTRLQTYLKSPSNEQHILQAKPIADMFPHTTVFFAGTFGYRLTTPVRRPKYTHSVITFCILFFQTLQDLHPGVQVVILRMSSSCLRQSIEHSTNLLRNIEYSKLRPSVCCEIFATISRYFFCAVSRLILHYRFFR